MRNKNIFLLIIGLAIVGVVIYGFSNVGDQNTTPSTLEDERPIKAYEDCTKKWPPDLCKMFIPEERIKLYDICAKTEMPKRVSDTTVYPDNKIAVIRWWDSQLQENIAIYLPYEPEAGFAGCSESTKSILEHIKETQIP
ncbi:MAG: hypothetical protein DDT22_01109 [candidate division WS2 bacterium]|nr:hypothetical protein [Candidatus Lithacetigena glycinireducens]